MDPKPEWLLEIAVPLGVEGLYTYAMPSSWETGDGPPQDLVGCRVRVPFGKRKQYVGLVMKVHQNRPSYPIKEALERLDAKPIWGTRGHELWSWMLGYYFCSPGALMGLALPALLRVGSESVLVAMDFIEEEGSDRWQDLHPLSKQLWERLRQGPGMSLEAVQRWMVPHNPSPWIQELMEAGLIGTLENFSKVYRPKSEAWVAKGPRWLAEGAAIMPELERSPRQLEFVMAMHAVAAGSDQVSLSAVLSKLKLTRTPTAVLQSLVEKGLLLRSTRWVPRVRLKAGLQKPLALNPVQADASLKARHALTLGQNVLLHGVTGSGKTHVYLDLLREVLDRGEQVLFLLPEIALTHQLVQRVAEYVGVEVGVYHSRYSDHERVELWNLVRDGGVSLILAPRSGVFLPFARLGMIIVDEEHDPSYKQQDRSPAYQARDVALWLGSVWKIPVVLGSATPSAESWQAAQSGRMSKVDLTMRFADQKMPEWVWVDMIRENQSGRVQGEFSSTLLEAMRDEISAGRQVLLFKNRRGYAPSLHCEDCAWTARCNQCDLALVYHKSEHRLRCHGCGQVFASPPGCSSCGSTRLVYKGYGTQKIEESLALLLPEVRVARLDQDAVRSKNLYGRTLDAFQRGDIQVLVGTQMISKGLDFPGVNLVGVLDADQGLFRSQFRAQERSYQLLAQLAGRSGRHQGQGRILLQTRMPHHPLFGWLERDAYAAFMDQELLYRSQFGYPPYVRLLRIGLSHPHQSMVEEAAAELAGVWRPVLGSRLLGPAPPLTALLRNEHRLEFWIKSEKNSEIRQRLAEWIPAELKRLLSMRKYLHLKVFVDVDPE